MDYFSVSFFIFICYCIYLRFKKNLDFFEKLSVPCVPGWPVLGNMKDVIFRHKHFTQVINEIYNLNSDAKYVGFFDFIEPVFMLRDLELIKDVTIKNFDSFPDHKSIGDADLDPLIGCNLFNLKGHKWKEMRTMLTPSFTSSKMKMMFHLMIECAENVVKFLKEMSEDDRKMIPSKDLFNKYANDVVASCSFGLSLNSLEEPDNEFYILGKKAINMEGILGLKLLFSRTFPNLVKLFKIRLFDKRTSNFYTELVRTNIKIRDEKGITRSDMLQMLMEKRKNSNLDIDQITAQAFAFFFAGFDTTTSTICMIVQELAINPEIQTRLQNEIDEVMIKCNGKPTFEAIKGMSYLDAVFHEVNRLHSQCFILDRVCKVPYELAPNLNGMKPIKLQPGMRIIIPCHSIHRDPKYYVDPDKFNPNRFYGKKITINDVLNLGFGIGPRGCIANRFAILEIKIIIVYLLAGFNLKQNEKTCIPTRYSKKSVPVQADGGFWLSIEPRDSEN